jgi:hypothetical protein
MTSKRSAPQRMLAIMVIGNVAAIGVGMFGNRVQRIGDQLDQYRSGGEAVHLIEETFVAFGIGPGVAVAYTRYASSHT